ncbi:MAG: hypothetical protein AAGJ31_09835, partial [Verrucomicrobiota bacterium]
MLPERIARSSGEILTIIPSAQNSDLVGSIHHSSGQIVVYTYESFAQPMLHSDPATLWWLTSVSGGTNGTLNYGYEVTAEQSTAPPKPPKNPALWGDPTQWQDLTDPDLSPVEHYHGNMTALDQGNGQYALTYVRNESLVTYHDSPWWEGEYVISGLPMQVSAVTELSSPDEETAFAREGYLSLSSSQNDLSLQQNGWNTVQVSSTQGGEFTFTYQDFEVVRLDTTNDEQTSVFTTPLVARAGSYEITQRDPGTPAGDGGTVLVSTVPNLALYSLIEERFGSQDTDGDGFSDGWENTVGSDPLLATSIPAVTDPYLADSDQDGISNVEELLNQATNPFSPGSEAEGLLADGILPDADGDGMPDEWEARYGLNPNDPTDARRDDDYDRLSNLMEYEHGSIPVVNFAFTLVERSEDLATLNDRGELIRLAEAGGGYRLETWERGVWEDTAAAGDVLPGMSTTVDLAQNNFGLKALLLADFAEEVWQGAAIVEAVDPRVGTYPSAVDVRIETGGGFPSGSFDIDFLYQSSNEVQVLAGASFSLDLEASPHAYQAHSFSIQQNLNDHFTISFSSDLLFALRVNGEWIPLERREDSWDTITIAGDSFSPTAQPVQDVATLTETALELRILDNTGLVSTLPFETGASAGELLAATDSGQVLGNFTGADGLVRGFQWMTGDAALALWELPSESLQLLEGNDQGHLLALDGSGQHQVWDGTQWSVIPGEALALSARGEVLIALPASNGQRAIEKWVIGSGISSSLGVNWPGTMVEGWINEVGEVVLQDPTGTLPAQFIDAQGASWTLQAPYGHSLQNPKVAVHDLNDLGEVGGAIIGLAADGSEEREALSWMAGATLFDGYLEQSEILAVSNSGL